jgi:hypothetical protein
MIHEAEAERQRVGSQGDWWYDRARTVEGVYSTDFPYVWLTNV